MLSAVLFSITYLLISERRRKNLIETMAPKNLQSSDDDGIYIEEDSVLGRKVNLSHSEPDVYNQTHPIETAELIATGFSNLEEELSKISISEKRAYMRALNENPDIVNDAHKLMFLRCEVFNAHVSRSCNPVFKNST